nr:hypothetical protein [Acidimicrobiia bacterium]
MNGDGSAVWSTLATVAGLAILALVLLVGAAARTTVTAGSRARPAPERTRRPSRCPSRRTLGVAAVMVVAVATVAAGGFVALLVAATVVAVMRRRRRSHREAARRKAIEAALPDAIELLVLCVHAGRSPTQAVVELARRAPPAVVDGFAAVEL